MRRREEDAHLATVTRTEQHRLFEPTSSSTARRSSICASSVGDSLGRSSAEAAFVEEDEPRERRKPLVEVLVSGTYCVKTVLTMNGEKTRSIGPSPST